MKVEHHESKQICIGFTKDQLIDAMVAYVQMKADPTTAHEVKEIRDAEKTKNTSIKYSLISGGKAHNAGLDLQIVMNIYKGSENGKEVLAKIQPVS